MESSWLRKHQELVPSIYLCFYSLESDPTVTSLRDNQLKTDINTVKYALSQSGYKTRIVVILLSSIIEGPSMDAVRERTETIRRGTALDNKSFFVIPRQKTPLDLESAIDNIVSGLYAVSGEYYRELARHARRKKARGVAPQATIAPSSGSSQTLSAQAWNVRYDFKMGVFAEFRQEMDAAARSYEQAYETLLGTDVMEIIPSWKPRWSEARLLSDIISIRVIRCLLWTGQTTAAVRRWQLHRYRIGDLVDRRGRGTNNYCWEAWESIWAQAMAALIERTEIPDFQPSTPSPALFLQPEKSAMGDRLRPWERLHHTGYWYRAAARHESARRALARRIPDEYREKPAASAGTMKTSIYDVYMCPEPYDEVPLQGGAGVDHARLIIECLRKARAQFQLRAQRRISAELSFECAKELSSLEAWPDVLAVLLPLWEDMSFRAEGWWDVAEELCWMLRHAAAKVQRADLVVAVDWELLNRDFTWRPGWHYDLKRSLDGIQIDKKPSIALEDATSLSVLKASFVFGSDEEKAGSTVRVQVAVSSNAFPRSAPLALQEIRVFFEGSLRDIVLQPGHDQDATEGPGVVVLSVALEETDSSSDEAAPLTGKADLVFYPDQVKVFEMSMPLREAGEAKATAICMKMQTDSFDLEYRTTFDQHIQSEIWHQKSTKKKMMRLNPHALKILPKPPKLELRLVRTAEQYYTNEPITLEIEVANAEESTATSKLDTILFGDGSKSFIVRSVEREKPSTVVDEDESAVGGLPLPALPPGQSTTVVVSLGATDNPAAYELRLKATYSLSTDPATQVVQSTAIRLNIVHAFEASFDLLPRLHPDPWPSVFDADALLGVVGDDGQRVFGPNGLAQQWCLVTRYASFALEELCITDLDVLVRAVHGDVDCSIAKRKEIPPDGTTVSPRTMEEARFELTARRWALEDRAPATVDASFVISWRRVAGGTAGDAATSPPNVTAIPIPRLLVTVGEPRVLASASYATPSSSSCTPSGTIAPSILVVQLAVYVENPSSHLLTFGLTMEPSDDFAFSGPKTTTLHVLPLSRRVTTYRLVPLVRGTWLRPTLQVRDKYFQKVLRVLPTGDGMKADRDGFLVWVPPEDEAEEAEE